MTESQVSETGLVLELEDDQATQRLGSLIASVLVPGDVVLLLGDLGAGKTTLVKGVLRELSDEKLATSPTFGLCHVYDSDPVICHVDCWRMTDERELIDLALDEMLDDGAIALIEWGELARARFGADSLIIDLQSLPLTRRARITATGRARTRVDDLGALLERVREES